MPGQDFPKPFLYQDFPLPFTIQRFPLVFDRPAEEFSRYVALLEIDFPSGTRRYSVHGVRAPEFFYADQILRLGTISRESPDMGGAYAISDLTVSLANRLQEFSVLAAIGPIYDSPVRVLLGDPQWGLAEMTSVFVGRLTGDWSIEDGNFSFTAHDFRMDRFGQDVAEGMTVLTSDTFPNLPADQQAHLVPVVYGDVDIDPAINLVGYDKGGPLPAYLIDPALNRYVVAAHVCKAVPRVFVYGVLAAPAGYTVSQQTYDGVPYTVIDFTVSPIDPNRTTELEVTVSVQGKTNDGTTGGTLIENPAAQLMDYLETYTDTDLEAELDLSFSLVQNEMSDLAYKGAWAVVKRDDKHADIIAKWSESFQCQFFATKDGSLGLYLHTPGLL